MKTSLRLTIAAVLGWAIVSLSTVPVQAQFNYVINNGTITITGYTGPGGVVTIPSTINGLPVASIDYWTFDYRADITAITVDPRSEYFCGVDGVLFDKSQKTLIRFPIGKAANSYVIPSGVNSIGSLAFRKCVSLTNVTIPDTVTSLGNRAFEGCFGLTSVSIPGTITNWPTECGGFGPSVSLAFYNCINLTTVTLENGIPFIAPSAFLGCTGLRDIALPSSVEAIMAYAFHGCASLTNVSLPMGLGVIESEAFAGCAGLVSLTLPDSIVDIGSSRDWTSGGTFSGCTSLTNVIIGKGLTSIGEATFSGCSNLLAIRFRGNEPEIMSGSASPFEGSSNVLIYHLPGTIGWGATFGERPTAPWFLPHPVMLTTAPNFGIQADAFGFRISWATNATVVVEASTTLANPVWSPASTNTLVNGWCDFRDPEWTNYPARFYRVRAQ